MYCNNRRRRRKVDLLRQIALPLTLSSKVRVAAKLLSIKEQRQYIDIYKFVERCKSVTLISIYNFLSRYIFIAKKKRD